MAGGTGRLGAVVAEAVETLDERFDGYHAAATAALTRIVQTQSETTSDAQRAREVDRIIESLGEQLQATTEAG